MEFRWAAVALFASSASALAQVTERVDLTTTGLEANGDAGHEYGISADTRFVAFASVAQNLVPGDTNNKQDVFVRDRLSGTTERVSVSSTGAQGNHWSVWPSMSDDGRFVAFMSMASNLGAGDTNGAWDILVRDLQAGTTEIVSLSSSGVQTLGTTDAPKISADGRFVCWADGSPSLVAGDTNGFIDVVLRDRLLGTTELVSVSSTGAQGNSNSDWPGLPSSARAISADGRYVAFGSLASNLVPNDTNGMTPDIFVRDRLRGTTELVSVDSSGAQGNQVCDLPSISADGRFVAYQTAWDVFAHDRLSGSTELVSVSSTGGGANGTSSGPLLSPDGRFVVFRSGASNLVAGDTYGLVDVFLRDRGVPNMISFCTSGQVGVIACPCANPPAGADRGCDNSAATGGAVLVAGGSPSLAADTLGFGTSDEMPTATSIVVQGTAPEFGGIVFGQGVRCVGGGLRRLYVKTASVGSIQAPSGADPSVSARSAALGDPIVAGQHRYYMVQYRDPIVLGGCPSTSTFNATNALDVPWQP